jgi:hypothetical protein
MKPLLRVGCWFVFAVVTCVAFLVLRLGTFAVLLVVCGPAVAIALRQKRVPVPPGVSYRFTLFGHGYGSSKPL